MTIPNSKLVPHKLHHTADYDWFEHHPSNRNVHMDSLLTRSMAEKGFMPSGAIHCVLNGSGHLKIIRGNNRFHVAMQLKLPIWYIVDESNTDIFLLEGNTKQNWSVRDHAVGRSRSPKDPSQKHCESLLLFAETYKPMPLGVCAELLEGGVARGVGGGAAAVHIKEGTFRVTHQKQSEELAQFLKDINIKAPGATFVWTKTFVAAMARVVRLPEFDRRRFVAKVKKHIGMLEHRPTTEAYVQMIDQLYNYASRDKRLAITVLVDDMERAQNQQRQRENKKRKAE